MTQPKTFGASPGKQALDAIRVMNNYVEGPFGTGKTGAALAKRKAELEALKPQPSPALTATDEIEAAEARGAKTQSALGKGVADGTIKLTSTKPEPNDDWHQPAQKDQA